MEEIRKWIAPLLTLLMWAIACCLLLLIVNVVFTRSQKSDFIIILSVLIMLLTNIIWTPTGIERAEKTKRVYNTTLKYHNRANYIVEKQLFEELRVFCEKQNEQYLIDITKHKLAQFLLVQEDLSKYIELKKKAQEKAIESRVLGFIVKSQVVDNDFIEYKKKYNKKQQLILDRLSKKPLRFKKITPNDIIRGHKTKDSLVPVNREYVMRYIKLFGKVVWGLAVGAFMGFLIWQKKDNLGWGEVVQIITWTFSIAMNIYTSINTGFKSVYVYRYQYLAEKMDKCAEFFKYQNIDTIQVDNLISASLIK